MPGTSPRTFPGGGRRPLLRCGVLAAALLGACAVAWGGNSSWRDIESRIQYGYYTEDARALHDLNDTLAALDTHDKMRGYYAALLAWRQALLSAQGTPALPDSSTAQLAEHCVSEADTVLALQADFAEALALRSACLATRIESSGVLAPVVSYRARRDLDRARELAPRNPRVLLIDAMNDYELPPARGGNRERALVKLRQAVAAFEAERSDVEHLPGWGASEAWLLLAQSLLDHGDAVAARDALERALLIAPQFAQARRLMAKVLSG